VRAQVSAGSRRSRLETEEAARPPIPPSPATRRHSPPRSLAATRSGPASRAATQPQHRLYRPHNASFWGFVEVVRHHALHADVELAIHIRLPASDGPMRSQSVDVSGGADGESHGVGK
jgi:hypothetical protein